MRPFTVQVDQSRTPRARRYEYPPAGPVAEGAGEGIGASEPAKVRVVPTLLWNFWCAAPLCQKSIHQAVATRRAG